MGKFNQYMSYIYITKENNQNCVWRRSLKLTYKLCKKVDILRVSCQYILSLIMFIVDNKKNFQINLSVHGLSTRNKNQLHLPIANMSCCQRVVSYSAMKIFNSLPNNVKNFRNDSVHFKIVRCKCLIYHSFYLLTEFF
jgi:hypothetical protein